LIYRLEELQGFWEASCNPQPIVIVGGGRWGRVWASVVANAAGSSRNIALVSRNHAMDVRQWLGHDPLLRDAHVFETIEDAMHAKTAPVVAIIASRPRDHVRDATQVLEAGGHVLIEKPIGPDTEEARRMLQYAADQALVAGVATEFSFLPALHFLAAELHGAGDQIRSMDVDWRDPVGEIRHNGSKRNHSEMSILEDLLPHFVSIIRALVPDAALALDVKNETATAGKIGLTDGHDRYFCLHCDKAAGERTRSLKLVGNKARILLDFSGEDPKILWNDKELPLPREWRLLNSTLRLELGAFLSAVETGAPQNPLVDAPDLLLRLQDALGS